MEWDVINLKHIEEFENLDYWTLLKISELANRAEEFEERVKEATEELREERDEYEGELDNAEHNIRDLETSVERLSNLLKECYETGHKDVKNIVEKYDIDHPYHNYNWWWLDKNK